ncbi:unnamed protein product [Heligmosomoides polygyrus]|uniref:CLIP1_ZNF domain-containing protein n=1 Tax=Heligmosomoides polygyrus TaxID=6339 RepID=A0A3P7ZWG9_HELPZ|nr:unnamed protein product [Heligmosomoides polygyrus]
MSKPSVFVKEVMHGQHENELKLVRTELLQQAASSSTPSEQMQNELTEALTRSKAAAEAKVSLENELKKLREELDEKQREITSLRLVEANASVVVSEARQKITKLRDIYNELERDWQNKQLRLCEKIDELSMELEQAKSRTQNEEIEALKLAFTKSIIADQRRKEVKLQQEIEALKTFSTDSIVVDARRLSHGNRDVKPRMYCDICEEFDKHETEQKKHNLLLDAATSASASERLDPEDRSPSSETSGVKRGDTVVVRRAASSRIQHGMLLQPKKHLLIDTAASTRVSEHLDAETGPIRRATIVQSEERFTDVV